MHAPGIRAGLSDSLFLAGISDREREPARVTVSVLGGVGLGLLASTCLMILVMIGYAVMIGEAGLGFEGMADAGKALTDDRLSSPVLAVMRLIIATAVDGGFLVVFVAFAAALAGQSLHAYLTAAFHIRWRLLGVSMLLSAAAMAPVVLADRLIGSGGAVPPVLGVSPLILDRVGYVAASLLLIPAAAAEELFFRGWLLRQSAAFLRNPVGLILLNAVLFSALHFDFNPDAFLTRALMGGAFAYMTLRLGGVEFSTGVHAVNNIMVLLFIQPLNLAQAAPSQMSAWSLLEDAALVVGYVLITELVARHGGLRRLAGVRDEEVSHPADVSAHYS